MARRAAFLDSIRTAVDRVVLVDAGNFTGTQIETAEARSLFLLETMKQLQYDAVTLGENDAALGGELLRSLVQEGTYPFVSANIVDAESRKLVCEASRVVERDGLRIGITAVTEFPPAVMAAVRAARLETIDPVEALRSVLPELRRRADFVILLSRTHSSRAAAIGEKFPNAIDVVVVGNREPGRGLVHPESGGAVYLMAGDRGQAFGIAKVALEGTRVQRITGDEEVLDKHHPEHPEVVVTVGVFLRNLNDLLRLSAAGGGPAGASPDGHYYLGAESCVSCHVREYEIWSETPHAHAFETLVLKGQEALPECYRCHVTGHGDPIGYDPAVESARRLVNVQCEVCHDKGSRHARDGSYGRSLLMQSCAGCHDPANSPDFDPEVYWLMMEH
ncbi:MAG: multiheme c-type cytochrome [bacterium]